MTPKEKAEKLVSKYLWPQRYFKELANTKVAKECALIAVYEIISCLKDDDFYIQGETNINEIIDYWQQVKQEIENL